MDTNIGYIKSALLNSCKILLTSCRIVLVFSIGCWEMSKFSSVPTWPSFETASSTTKLNPIQNTLESNELNYRERGVGVRLNLSFRMSGILRWEHTEPYVQQRWNHTELYVNLGKTIWKTTSNLGGDLHNSHIMQNARQESPLIRYHRLLSLACILK